MIAGVGAGAGGGLKQTADSGRERDFESLGYPHLAQRASFRVLPVPWRLVHSGLYLEKIGGDDCWFGW